jgi:hypothetical protein
MLDRRAMREQAKHPTVDADLNFRSDLPCRIKKINHLADKKRSRAVVLSCVHELAYLGVFERLRGSEIGRGCAVRKRSRAVCKVARAV